MIPDMDHCGLPAQTLPKVHYADCVAFKTQRQNRFATDSPLEGAGFEPSVPRESNGENAKEPVSPLERKMPEMSSTQHRPKVVDLYKRLFSRLKARVSIRCCKSTE